MDRPGRRHLLLLDLAKQRRDRQHGQCHVARPLQKHLLRARDRCARWRAADLGVGQHNSEIEDQHMGRGRRGLYRRRAAALVWGEFQHFHLHPDDQLGPQNTADYVANLGSEPKGNVYSANSLINFGWGRNFSGTTSQAFSMPSGPYGYLQTGNNREPMRGQTADTFFTGNLTRPIPAWIAGLLPRRSSTRASRLSRRRCLRAGLTTRRRRSPTLMWAATWATIRHRSTATRTCSTRKGYSGPRPAP